MSEKKFKTASPKFKAGDWVTYSLPPGRAYAEVIRDSGPLAPGGEHVYFVRHIYDWGEPIEFEIVESNLQASDPPDPLPQQLPEELWSRWTGAPTMTEKKRGK